METQLPSHSDPTSDSPRIYEDLAEQLMLVYIAEHHEPHHHRKVQQNERVDAEEQQEVSVVPFPYALIEPNAVVVERRHAKTT